MALGTLLQPRLTTHYPTARGSVCMRRSIPCGMVACRALQALDDQLIALGLPTSLSAKLRDFYRFM